MDVLIVAATAAEAAQLSALPARVVVCGVGPVAAALATQAALLDGPRPDLVVSAGIGGAYPQAGLAPGSAAVASEMVYGDLGAWNLQGGNLEAGQGFQFLSLDELGLSVFPDGPAGRAANPGRFPAWVGSAALASRLGLAYGPFVTVSGVTGGEAGAQALVRRFPGALIEGMEGAGVAQAAALHGLPCTEIRGVSNLVGPRDRAAWQIGPALAALQPVLRDLLESAPLEL
ncbi:futalosine hydrolase [Deinococcus sp.]|uniref:futalosine hydrolase n=1 Tax=Deinococcus sp. TaxID=47478 RepID=UPI003C7C12CE